MIIGTTSTHYNPNRSLRETIYRQPGKPKGGKREGGGSAWHCPRWRERPRPMPLGFTRPNSIKYVASHPKFQPATEKQPPSKTPWPPLRHCFEWGRGSGRGGADKNVRAFLPIQPWAVPQGLPSGEFNLHLRAFALNPTGVVGLLRGHKWNAAPGCWLAGKLAFWPANPHFWAE